jgi:hypothetical protein
MASPLATALMMQPGGLAPGQMQPTNVIGSYQLSQDAAEKNYQAQLQRQNAMWGGLAGLGSAGILAAPNLYNALKPASPFASAADAGTAGGVGTGGFNFLDAAAPAAASGATDAVAAGAPVAADLASLAAPAAVDAGAATAGMSFADMLAFLPLLLA